VRASSLLTPHSPPVPPSAAMESVRLNTDCEDTGDERSVRQMKKLRYGIIGASVVCTALAVCFFALRSGSFNQSQEMAEASQVELEAEADRLENYNEFVQDEGNEIVSQELLTATMCKKDVGCELALKSVTNNNLDGLDKGKPVNLRYGKVCTYQGTSIDMVVTARGSYSAKPGKSGMLGKLGVISMQAGTATSFVFAFVKTGTNTPIVISSLRWSVLDFDCHTSGCAVQSEKVTFWGSSNLKMGTGAQMLKTQLAGGVTITSTEKGGGADNPTDPTKLTALQERRQVTVEYKSVSTFTIDYELAGTNKNGYRNFIFSAESSVKGQVPVPCPTPPPTPPPAPPTPPPTTNSVFPPVTEKAMVFVLDVSGSMGCRYYCLLPKMKTEFKKQIDGLKDFQWFSIVTFSQRTWTWKDTLQRVNAANIAAAKDFVDGLEAQRGTYYKQGLSAAYAMGTPAGIKLNAIYFISDGEPNDCSTSSYDACFTSYYAKDPSVKIRAILLHDKAVAKKYLEPMARLTGGDYHESFI